MGLRSRRHARRRVVASAAALAVAALTGLPLTAAAGPDSTYPFDPSPPIEAVVTDKLRTAHGPVTVFVQLKHDSVLELAQAGKKTSAATTSAAIESMAETVVEAIDDPGATELYTTVNAVAGVVVTADAAALRALAARDDVVSIMPIAPKYPTTAGTDTLTRALDVWTETDNTGAGIDIAIVDTGIDYTHADFGGPGTTAAFDAIDPDAPSALFPTTKVKGGWDFVGDAYNPDAGNDTAMPDGNPLDCNGHGSHVAGIAAGYGVEDGGTTFGGPADARTADAYTPLTAADVMAMDIGPGSAPEASLYAFKVFGCDGSTYYAIAALDMIASPDYVDTIDIVNMSLGSDFSPVDDPESLFIATLADQGIMPVISSGNGGDYVDVGGSPGNSAAALTVANSVGATAMLDAVIGTDTDSAASDFYPAQYSVAYNYSGMTLPGTPMDVVVMPDAGNPEGCSAFSDAAKAAVADKVVWLQWTDDDLARPCGSGARFTNASDAGAAGVLLDSTRDLFEAGIAGNAAIPGAQLTATASATLRPIADAGRLQVTFASELLAFRPFDTNATDTINSSSSRGVHGSLGVAKPDVAAPGTNIYSAGVGLGAQGLVKSGTSMSAPHVAGIAATVRQAHPDWTPAQVKAVVMNTATHDVATSAGAVYGPNRVGSGRVDALDAARTLVIAYGSDDPSMVSLSFGVTEATGPVTMDRQVTVQNMSDEAQSLAASYAEATPIAGVTVSVSPATIAVPAGGEATVTVSVAAADVSALRKTLDPTMETIVGGLPRDYVPLATGWLELAPTGPSTAIAGEQLRVPVTAEVRAASELTTSAVVFDAPTTSEASVSFTGAALDQGEGTEAYVSKVAPMQLLATSPMLDGDLSATLRSGDIAYVGAASTVPQLTDAAKGEGAVAFGIATHGAWAQPTGPVVTQIELDTNLDGDSDYALVPLRYSDTDVMVVYLVDLAADTMTPVEPLNSLFADVDTNVFDTTVMMVPVALADVGFSEAQIVAGDTPMGVSVYTFSPYADDPDSLLDAVDAGVYNPSAPELWFGPGEMTDGAFLYQSTTTDTIPAHRDVAAQAVSGRAAADGPSVLTLHFLNKSGNQAQVTQSTITQQGEPTPTTTGEPTPTATSGTPGAGGQMPISGFDGWWIAAIAAIAIAGGGTAIAIRRRMTDGPQH